MQEEVIEFPYRSAFKKPKVLSKTAEQKWGIVRQTIETIKVAPIEFDDLVAQVDTEGYYSEKAELMKILLKQMVASSLVKVDSGKYYIN